ncbi:hypothetical protein NA56DRAFT_742289 [Hyaloscypha hepaticicola]|uniref:Uncharacterized protein n=1 Tax=Hyaloscypha hepaticicola TaxID=2082293 RepID=A0A2J6QPD9_9HELO|nr:hypothetical protein NA56DRAFT_742289 [Hyaloscypha hepaticicola]
MPSEPITARRETKPEKRSAVWTWYRAGKTLSEIARLEDLTKSTIAGIIRRVKARTGENKRMTSLESCSQQYTRKFSMSCNTFQIWPKAVSYYGPEDSQEARKSPPTRPQEAISIWQV